MEDCKVRASAAGLKIYGETLEYIITNENMIELNPKIMIPTLYDFWANDIEVIRDKWIYDVNPHNAYETAINTRPAISFYNDNNPDWLNSMIFYHVLGHHDFFQNNVFFRNTWNDDFCGEALADKRLISRIREEMGAEKRWVDYVIEFARSADNLVGYYAELEDADKTGTGPMSGLFSKRANFYFGEFLKQRYEEKAADLKFYHDEVERFNSFQKQFGQKQGEDIFFEDFEFRSKFPEFMGVFQRRQKNEKVKSRDILHHLIEHSPFVNKDENKWMKDVISVIRKTSLYFQPQIRTKIINEGWASLWHERLFMADERMRSHEIDFADVNAKVLANPRVGLNPYFIGKSLLEFIEGLAEKGKLSYEYLLIRDTELRKRFEQKTEKDPGKKAMFEARRNFDDIALVNFLSDADFQDFVDKHRLFVAGSRINPEEGVEEIYVKSRSGKEYRKILNKRLYHPPYVVINEKKTKGEEFYLDHIFEGRSLVTQYIPQVLMGLSCLWGGIVKLETTELDADKQASQWLKLQDPDYKPKYRKIRVLYTYENKNLSRKVLGEDEGGYNDD